MTRTTSAFKLRCGGDRPWRRWLCENRTSRSLRGRRNVILPGQVFDGQAGLHENGFRFYDPAIGGYQTSDPSGLAAGVNTYAYTDRNPISRVDPDGLQAFPEVLPFARPTLPSWVRSSPIDRGTTVDPAVPITDVSTPGDPNGCDPCKGLRNSLLEHEQKLRDYINDPLHSDLMSRGYLWFDIIFRNGANAESIVQGRIRNLQKQIDTFRRDYVACMEKHGGGA